MDRDTILAPRPIMTESPLYFKPVLDTSANELVGETGLKYLALWSSLSNIPNFTPGLFFQTDVSAYKQGWTFHLNENFARPNIDQVLSELAVGCAVDNWDGYGANRIDNETIEAARIVLNSLPPYVPFPDIAGEPGGEIGLEWRRGDAIAAVMIDKRFRLHYATIRGRTTERGAVDFVDHFPSRLASLIAFIA
jgi:hypothetical protein